MASMDQIANLVASDPDNYNGVELHVKYYEGYTRSFAGIILNSFSVNVTAGEVANFNLNLMGKGMGEDPDADDVRGFSVGEKLVTWDKASLRIFNSAPPDDDPNNADPYEGGTEATTASGGYHTYDDDDGDWIDNGSWPDDPSIVGPPGTIYDTLLFGQYLESFNLEASRNLSRRFVLGNSDLFGDLVEGMKSVTGSISSYTIKTGEGLGRGADYWDQYVGSRAYPIRLDIGANIAVKAGVRFHRSNTSLETGPVIATISFTGVTHHGRGAIEVS